MAFAGAGRLKRKVSLSRIRFVRVSSSRDVPGDEYLFFLSDADEQPAARVTVYDRS